MSFHKGLYLLKKYVPTITQIGCFAHIFNTHFYEIQECYGPSMLPTLSIYGDYLLLDKMSVKLSKLSIGDLIVFTSPQDPHTIACKRIIGMPGDTICVNPTSKPSLREYLKLPKGRIWVQGENGTNSTDSRVYGPLPMGLIKARVICRLFPTYTDFRLNINKLEKDPSIGNESLREVDLEYLTGVKE